MNNENLAFLQENLKYLGFGEKFLLNQELAKQIAGEHKTFELDWEAFFDEDHKLELTLYFRKSDQLDMYFFNKYDARLRSADDPELDKGQTFYISKGTGVTLKEAFNLLLGRSVNKDLISMDGHKYNAWIQLNFDEKDQHGNYKMRQYHRQYGYDLEKTLEQYPIRELKHDELRANLLRSLRKGNQHPVSFDKNTKTERMFIEANPQFKTINIYTPANRQGKRSVWRQEPASPKAQGETSAPNAGGKRQRDWKEEERAEQEEAKEEEMAIPENKQPSRKKIHK